VLGVTLIIGGLMPVVTGLIGWCPIYEALKTGTTTEEATQADA
jgi:hypothetical protein